MNEYFQLNKTKRSYTRLDSRKQATAPQDRVTTVHKISDSTIAGTHNIASLSFGAVDQCMEIVLSTLKPT